MYVSWHHIWKKPKRRYRMFKCKDYVEHNLNMLQVSLRIYFQKVFQHDCGTHYIEQYTELTIAMLS